MSFINIQAREHLKSSQLIRAFSLIDWESVKQRMGKRGRPGYGPSGYGPVNLLKALEGFYDLSQKNKYNLLSIPCVELRLIYVDLVPNILAPLFFLKHSVEISLIEYARK